MKGVLLIAGLLLVSMNVGAIEISADFPGGNIICERVDGDLVRLRQDPRDTDGWWFYWYFEVRGAAGRTVRFEFTDKQPIGVRGPAVSLDEGKTWSWLGHTGSFGSFTYTFDKGADAVRFSSTIPYTQANLDAFLGSVGEACRREQLCISHKGRAVERLHVGRDDAQYLVLVTARHHACESLAGFAVEGIIEEALESAWLRENACILVVPFVDKDGVEDGDQGKNRRPHDHNRDYDDNGVHVETKALRAFVPQWLNGRPAMALDLHCPWLRGGTNEYIYQVGSSDQKVWQEQQKFAALLESLKQGPLPYRASDDIPFGKEWNRDTNYSAGTSCSKWVASLPGVRYSSSIEIPYANAGGVEVNAATAALFGRDLARAIEAYLKSLSDK